MLKVTQSHMAHIAGGITVGQLINNGQAQFFDQRTQYYVVA